MYTCYNNTLCACTSEDEPTEALVVHSSVEGHIHYCRELYAHLLYYHVGGGVVQ